MQLYAMQMLGLNAQQAGVSKIATPESSRPPSIPQAIPQPDPKDFLNQTQAKPQSKQKEIGATLIQPREKYRILVANVQTQVTQAFNQDLIKIGRGPNNDIVIKDDYASKNHAEIILNENHEMIVLNVSSTNSISINENQEVRPGERIKLSTGDILEIGYTKLKVNLRR